MMQMKRTEHNMKYITVDKEHEDMRRSKIYYMTEDTRNREAYVEKAIERYEIAVREVFDLSAGVY